jgi:ClpX C4-type zinc finger/Glyoxalase superfamily protein
MRDFRDAKVMAHALRDALKEKTIETTHSECLELVAKAFGYDNWNILSAKIETTDTFPSSPKGVEDAAPTTVFCTFCHKSQHDVRVLIAGPSSTYICDECVDVCDDVVGHNDDQVALELFKVDEEREIKPIQRCMSYFAASPPKRCCHMWSAAGRVQSDIASSCSMFDGDLKWEKATIRRKKVS